MDFYTPERDQQANEVEVAVSEALPSVFIIGDSISQDYTPLARELLKGRFNVERPRANCGDTRAGLANLDTWLGGRRWDVIHFNWGLHDLCYRHPDSKVYGNRDKVNGALSVSPDQYRANMEQLVVRLKSSAKDLIWASTTVVPPGDAGRFKGDEVRYNAVAAGIMQAHDIPVDDLYTLTAGFGSDLFTLPGMSTLTKTVIAGLPATWRNA